MKNMSDEKLLELLRDGDTKITDFLLEKYRNFVRAKARTYFLIGADREDVIQEGMIGLYKAIRDYRPENGSSFRTFADLCITRQIITAIKTATRQKHLPLNSYISLNKPAYEDENENTLIENFIEKRRSDPEEIMINKEKFQIFEEKLVLSLSKYESSVLKRYIRGNSYTQIAAELNKPEKSIDNALQRIKKKIEKVIEDYKEL